MPTPSSLTCRFAKASPTCTNRNYIQFNERSNHVGGATNNRTNNQPHPGRRALTHDKRIRGQKTTILEDFAAFNAKATGSSRSAWENQLHQPDGTGVPKRRPKSGHQRHHQGGGKEQDQPFPRLQRTMPKSVSS